jgi:hypothetical protein
MPIRLRWLLIPTVLEANTAWCSVDNHVAWQQSHDGRAVDDQILNVSDRSAQGDTQAICRQKWRRMVSSG